jgi:hypothetical protein
MWMWNGTTLVLVVRESRDPLEVAVHLLDRHLEAKPRHQRLDEDGKPAGPYLLWDSRLAHTHLMRACTQVSKTGRDH